MEKREPEGTSMKHEQAISDLASTRDGAKIVSTDKNGIIKVWDIFESHQLITEWTHLELESYPKITLSPDDGLAAVGQGTIGIYSLEGRRVDHSVKIATYLGSFSFSPDGDKIACSTCDNDIRVYNVKNGELILGPLQGHKQCIRRVLWSRDGSRIFSASYDQTIRYWDSVTGEQIGQPWMGHTDYMRSLSLSPDGSILASTSFDQTVRFWDTTTGHPIGQRLPHDQHITTANFLPSGESVVSAGWDGRVYLWQVPWLNATKHHVMSLLVSWHCCYYRACLIANVWCNANVSNITITTSYIPTKITGGPLLCI
ncbi:WD40-repeat-containing domain protein [Tylopilus felleus]